MQLLPNVAFTIDPDVYLAGDPAAEPPVAEEKYGAEFAGVIEVAHASVGQDMEIGCRATAMAQAFGVIDPSGLPLRTYQLVQAFAFFTVVAVKRPDWLADTPTATPKRLDAVIHAHAMALQKLDEGKKNSAVSGSSTPTAT